MQTDNIILIGMMGTAKTSVGKALAKRKGMLFLDSDDCFTERFGDVGAFFEAYGEGMFRIEESRILYEFSRKRDAVISCGGGAVLNPVNMRYLKSSGTVVLLTASDETIYERVKNDTARPLLKGDVKKNIARLQTERAPVYLRYADVRVCTDGKTVDEIVDDVLAQLA